MCGFFRCFKPSSVALFTLSRTRVSTVRRQLNNKCVYFGGWLLFRCHVFMRLKSYRRSGGDAAIKRGDTALWEGSGDNIHGISLSVWASQHHPLRSPPPPLLSWRVAFFAAVPFETFTRKKEKKDVLWFLSAALRMDFRSRGGAGVVLCGCSSSSSRIYVSSVVI